MLDALKHQCLAEGCTTRPTFGIPDGRPLFCAKHKEDGMEDVVNSKCAAGVCLLPCALCVT